MRQDLMNQLIEAEAEYQKAHEKVNEAYEEENKARSAVNQLELQLTDLEAKFYDLYRNIEADWHRAKHQLNEAMQYEAELHWLYVSIQEVQNNLDEGRLDRLGKRYERVKE